MSTRITVTSAARTYDVVIEPGVLRRAADEVGPGGSGLIVADAAVADSHAATLGNALESAQWTIEQTTVTALESCKRIDAVSGIWDAALKARLGRHGVIFAVGGGLTGDIAGFAAATFLRGIDVVQVPTSLLAMADASVGGKTGINLPLPGNQGTGKNLAGAFWPPRCVLADPETLDTLPDREMRCGLAECVKHGMLGDASLLDMLDQQAQPLLDRAHEAIEAMLARTVAVKAAIVAEDERERGRRMHLNLGHTFAHAIEPIESLNLHHGEAVAIGLCAASACSARMGLVDDAFVEDLHTRLHRLGLPTCMAASPPIDVLMSAMRYDKKVLDGSLRLVLPVPGGVQVHDDVPAAAVEAAWAAVMPS